MMDTQIDEHEAAAKRAREQMVAELCEGGWISSDRVAAAFLAVPRHQFVDGAPLEEVYGAESIVRVKFDASGQCVSSLSAPRAQSRMITMSGIQAGDAILEIGSGGVNAAYLAELTGPSGLVVSADIDPDVTDRASRCLDRAGYSRVVVTLADGAYGVLEHAPYQRILVTAGAHDVVPEWVAQLAEGGTLTVPLHIRGINRVVSFIRDGAVLISTGHEMFGYVPMQGVARHTAEVVQVGGGVRLVFGVCAVFPAPRCVRPLICSRSLLRGDAYSRRRDNNSATHHRCPGSAAAEFLVMSTRRPHRRELAVTIANLRTELRQSQRENRHLRVENEILREAAEPLIHNARARDRFAFIHARRGRFGVKRLCRRISKLAPS